MCLVRTWKLLYITTHYFKACDIQGVSKPAENFLKTDYLHEDLRFVFYENWIQGKKTTINS